MNHAAANIAGRGRPTVTIRLDGNGRVYRPGETLSGQYRLVSAAAGDVKAVEVSVLWYTEGKGEEDLAVHEFDRTSAEDGERIEVGRPQPIRTVLPQSPLSYDGAIVKLRWCVRVRAFLQGGGEVVGQKVFQFGDVLPVEG